MPCALIEAFRRNNKAFVLRADLRLLFMQGLSCISSVNMYYKAYRRNLWTKGSTFVAHVRDLDEGREKKCGTETPY